ncbi:MAG: ATP-binding protein, partial [Polyangiales bacterium]
VAIRALLENAVESNEGGHALVEIVPTGGRVRIVIADRGPGMTEASFEKATEPLFTTKPGRLGLGLNIAERIARRHSGSVSHEPSERGARIALDLPAEAAK